MSCLRCWKEELTPWEKVKLYLGNRRMMSALELMVLIEIQRSGLGLRTAYEMHRDRFVTSGDEKEFERMLRHTGDSES